MSISLNILMSTTSAHLYKLLRAGARGHVTQEFLKGCPVNSDLSIQGKWETKLFSYYHQVWTLVWGIKVYVKSGRFTSELNISWNIANNEQILRKFGWLICNILCTLQCNHLFKKQCCLFNHFSIILLYSVPSVSVKKGEMFNHH